MNSRDVSSYRFGAYRLNPAARELFFGEELVSLPPKAFDALLWLFENRERAVGRDELGAAIWGKTDFTDGQLDQLIWGLRRALGDSGTEKTVIRTVPRFGYRWVAEVESAISSDDSGIAPAVASVDSLAPSEPLTIAASARKATSSLIARVGIIALTLILLAAIGWALSTRFFTTADEPAAVAPLPAVVTAPLIAVLPVAMDPDTDSRWAWLRLGLMDLIAARLTEGGVHVVPAHNILALTGPNADSPPAAEKVREVTGATVVITPSIHRGSDGWRLQLQLDGFEGAREVELQGTEPTTTARHAADRLLVMMNREPVAGRRGEEHVDEEEVALRIDAAVASQRFDVAQQIWDDIPPTIRSAPRVRFMGVHLLLAKGKTDAALAELRSLADSDADAMKDGELRASILQALGAVLARGGHLQEALERLDSAVKVASKGYSAVSYGDALQSRAGVNVMLGRWAEADADFAEARIAMEMIGNSLGLAELEANEASASINRQRYAEAEALQARAIERLERFPIGEALRVAYGNQISLELDLLKTAAALATTAKAIKTINDTSDERAVAWLSVHVSRAFVAAGRLNEAEQRLKPLVETLDPTSSPDTLSNAQLLLARIAFERSDMAEAVRLAASAKDLRSMATLTAEHFARGRSAAALLHIRALLAMNSQMEASVAVNEFSAWANQSNQPDVIAQLRVAEGLMSAHRGESAIARERFDAAVAAASRGAPATMALVVNIYGTQLLDADEIELATRVIGRVARGAQQDFSSALLQARLYHMLGQAEPWRRAMDSAERLAGERDIDRALTIVPTRTPMGGTAIPTFDKPQHH